jgi:hypothetical protein
MNSLPLISHHLFVAAIDEPGSNPCDKVDAADGKVIEVEVLGWAQPVPEPAPRPPRSSKSAPH